MMKHDLEAHAGADMAVGRIGNKKTARTTAGSRELDHLEGLIGYRLRRAQAAVSRSFVQGFADLDVRQTQLGVLSVVEASPGVKPSRAGALLGIKRANVGPLLDVLERRGLLRREPSSDDRRSQALFLTDEGRVLLAELHRREVDHETRIAAALSAQEQAQLLVLLKKVEAAALDGGVGRRRTVRGHAG